MKYRSTLFFKLDNHRRIEDYTKNDGDKMAAYMIKKKFKRPIDAWLDNLVAILDITFDKDNHNEWALDLQDRMYGPDALWAQMVMRLKYPVVCTPSKPENEFVLSGHSYGLHEGAVLRSTWTEWHVVCVVAPRLALLMRNDVLPEVGDKENIKEKDIEPAKYLQQYPEPDQAKSLFHNFAVARPRCSTSGKLSLSLFSLGSDVIQVINCLILEEFFDLPMIVFENRVGLHRALDAYLSRPITAGTFSMKRVSNEYDDAKFKYLKQLEKWPNCWDLSRGGLQCNQERAGQGRFERIG